MIAHVLAVLLAFCSPSIGSEVDINNNEPEMNVDLRANNLGIIGNQNISAVLYPQFIPSSFTKACVRMNGIRSYFNRNDCGSLCNNDPSNFQDLLYDADSSGLYSPICGFNINRFTLLNMAVPLAVANYSGSCYLTGTNVSLGNGYYNSHRVAAVNSDFLYYVDYTSVNLTWYGWTVICVPANTGTQSVPLLGGLLNAVLCPVNNLLQALNVADLVLLGCPVSSLPGFSASVSVTQLFSGVLNFNNINKINYNVKAGAGTLTTAVSFGSGIPTNQLSAVTDAVKVALTQASYLETLEFGYRNTYFVLTKGLIKPACKRYTNC